MKPIIDAGDLWKLILVKLFTRDVSCFFKLKIQLYTLDKISVQSIRDDAVEISPKEEVGEFPNSPAPPP
jgi:hypothetical protein